MATAKKKPWQPKEIRSEIYLFRIEKVMPQYSFGTNEGSLQGGSYSEYHHTEIETICVSRKRFESRRTLFTLMGDRSRTFDLTQIDQAT